MITVEQIILCGPCEDYPESRVRELIGGGKRALEILDLPIPAQDRIWVLTRRGMIPDALQHEFALRCADSVLHIYEQRYPGDTRIRVAIETKRRWLRGEATDEELFAAIAAARAAAWSAESSAESSAAWSAASAAARSAESAAARAAASAAARSAAWDTAWDTASAAESSAAWSAASAAESSAESSAAWSAARSAQIIMLREILQEKRI